MAYNPFKKLDELRYASSSANQAPKPYDPWAGYSSLQSNQNNTTTKPTYDFSQAKSVYTPKPTTTTTATTSTPSYLQTFETLADKQRKQSEERLGRAKEYQTSAYDERNRLLKESIPQLQNQFGQTQGYFDKAMVGATDKANLAKSNIEDTAGSTQRQNAESLRTGRANIANRFAGLGTSDSYGAGSHMQAQENQQSDFNRLTAENLKQKSNQLSEIENNLQTYQLDAQRQLDGLKSTLDQTVSQIQSNMRMNDLDKQKAIDSAVYDYEDSLNTIDTTLNSMYKDYQLKALELEKTSLSKGFMAGGKPENENDYKYLVENSDKYDKYGAMLGTGASTQKSKKADEIVASIDQILLDPSLGQVTGAKNISTLFPGTPAQTTKNRVNQLLGQLQLSNIDQLKGQGQITEGERAILRDAVTYLGTNQGDQDFVNTLTQLRDNLKKGTPTNSSTTNQGGVRMQSPTGQIGTLGQIEVEEALADGWRRI